MVGDEINDAVALAAADLGLALVNGTDIALRSADIILVRDDLAVVPDAIALSRRTLRTIRVNLGWAFGYNIAAIPIAAAGLFNPLIAAGAMALSFLCSSFTTVSGSRAFTGHTNPHRIGSRNRSLGEPLCGSGRNSATVSTTRCRDNGG